MLTPGVPPVCTGSPSFRLPGPLGAKGGNGGWEATFLNFLTLPGVCEFLALWLFGADGVSVK